ncbi:hypothetical protein [Streptomyces sp. LN785]
MKVRGPGALRHGPGRVVRGRGGSMAGLVRAAVKVITGGGCVAARPEDRA